MPFAESTVEEAALSWLTKLGYSHRYGPEIEPGEFAAERSGFSEVILSARFRQALKLLNPGLPQEALEEAFRKVAISQQPTLIANNHAFHRMLIEGIAVECRRADGSIRSELVRLADFENPDANDWLTVNQFTVVEDRHNRRADIVVFVNGLPLAVIELKNAADKDADIWQAFRQLATYKDQIPSLFTYNGVLVISDGLEARYACQK